MYPKRDVFDQSNFCIEDYFEADFLKEFYMRGFYGSDCFMKKEAVKRKLAIECKGFEDSIFNGYKKLLDFIIEIKKEIKLPV